MLPRPGLGTYGSMSEIGTLVFTGGAQCNNEDEEWVQGQFLVIGTADTSIKPLPVDSTLTLTDVVAQDYAVLQILSVTPENPDTADTTDDAVPVAYKWFNRGSGYLSVAAGDLTFLRLTVSGLSIASCGANDNGLGNTDPVSGLRLTLVDSTVSARQHYQRWGVLQHFSTHMRHRGHHGFNSWVIVRRFLCCQEPRATGWYHRNNDWSDCEDRWTVHSTSNWIFIFPKPPATDLKGKICVDSLY